jgi:integrase
MGRSTHHDRRTGDCTARFAEEYRNQPFARSADTAYEAIQRADRKLGIDFPPQVLRPAFDTDLVNAGCSPAALRRRMDHHDLSASPGFHVHDNRRG